ncbi:peptidyl-prolyl cis-trans isomerase [Candidatus Dependentiae bacterium]
MKSNNFSRKHLYVMLAFSPILLLSGCRPVDWIKEKLGMRPTQVKKGRAAKSVVGGQWVVKVGDHIAVSPERFEQEFGLLLEEKPQLKAMLPLMPNLEKDFARGLGNQEVISRFVKERNIDQKPEYLAKKARMKRAVEQMLNTEFFAQSFETAKISDADLQKFYDENKDSLQGIMISQGGINSVGVSFDSKVDAEAFLKKAKTYKNLDLQKLAKENGFGDKASDFGLVNGQTFSIDPVLRTKIMGMKSFPSVDLVAAGEKSFWVVQATAKKEATYRPLEEVKDGLRSVAEQTEKGKQLQKELEKLTQSYDIQINEGYFQKKMEAAKAKGPDSGAVTQQEFLEALAEASEKLPDPEAKTA